MQECPAGLDHRSGAAQTDVSLLQENIGAANRIFGLAQQFSVILTDLPALVARQHGMAFLCVEERESFCYQYHYSWSGHSSMTDVTTLRNLGHLIPASPTPPPPIGLRLDSPPLYVRQDMPWSASGVTAGPTPTILTDPYVSSGDNHLQANHRPEAPRHLPFP